MLSAVRCNRRLTPSLEVGETLLSIPTTQSAVRDTKWSVKRVPAVCSLCNCRSTLPGDARLITAMNSADVALPNLFNAQQS